MKKVVFSGFCMLSGLLLATLVAGLQIRFPSFLSGVDIIAVLLGIALALYGFYLGVSALNDKE